MKIKIRDLEWFYKRVGKKVYRDSNGCSCKDCADILENGIYVHNSSHAQYLFDCQNDFGSEGVHLNYRDKK